MCIRVLLLALGLVCAACDSAEGQRDFGSTAFQPPNGLGNDDWQIGPLYETVAFFLDPPADVTVPVGSLLSQPPSQGG